MKTDENITNGNKLIAEFMGWSIDNSFPDKERTYRKDNSIELDTTFKFHLSWDLLMPVLKKLSETHHSVRPNITKQMNDSNFDIKQTWQSCVWALEVKLKTE